MRTRSLVRSAAVMLVLAAALAAIGRPAAHAAAAAAAATAPSQKPNVVFILTDDQTVDSVAHMPFLSSHPDGHWVGFPNAFLTTPLCCPSRSTILSGEYPFRTGVENNRLGHLLDESSTVATWLSDAGYHTGMVGRYLNLYPFDRPVDYIPPGWDYWAAMEQVGYYDWTMNLNGQLLSYGETPADYSTDVLTGKAVSFLNQAPSDKPFLLYFTPNAPHSPRTPAPGDTTALSDVPPYRPPNFNEADVSDKPAWVQALPRLTASQEKVQDQNQLAEYRTNLAVDRGIQQMFDALQARGVLDNTVVILMTDNGLSMGSHRWSGKTCEYEECIQTPLLVRYPGAVQHSDSRLINNVDMASTFADIAGATPTRPQDGHSFLPLLRGESVPWRDGLLIHWAGDPGGDDTDAQVPPYWGIRTASAKYVELATGEVELYDLTADPYEMNNVANDPAYASERASLAARLVGLKDRITVSLSPPTVAADGTSGTTATARIIDASGNPRAGLHPSLSVSGDARTSPVSDNGDGTYSARITASTTPGDQTVTFAEGDVDGRAVVHFVPPIQLAVTPDVVPADGLSTAKATVTLVGPDGSPAPGRVVAVTTNGDATIAPAIDNGDGTYTATIKASRTPDDETITATAGAVRATAVLHEVDSRITVRLKKDTLVADGRSTTTATATVTDLSGRPRSGRTVTITTSGDAAVSSVTDAGSGTYTATITASKTADDETITAATGPATASTVLHEQAGTPTSIALSLDPSTVGADGSSTSTATAFVRDVFGNGVGGQSVKMTAGTSSLSVLDDGGGQYHAVVPARSVAGDVTVTVTTRGTSLRATGVVHFVTPPLVAAVTPNVRGQAAAQVPVTIRGSGFRDGATVSLGPEVFVSGNPTVANSGEIDLTASVWSDATTGPRDVTVLNADGTRTTCAGCFAVTPRPKITSLTPFRYGQGAPAAMMTINGANFAAGMTFDAGSGFTVLSATQTATQLQQTVSVSSTAPLGLRIVTLTNPDGGMSKCSCLNVVPAPTVSSVSPADIAAGSPTVTMTINGANFMSGSAVSLGAGVTVGPTSFVSTTTLRAKVTVAGSATPGPRNVTLVGPDGNRATCTGCFTVDPP